MPTLRSALRSFLAEVADFACIFDFEVGLLFELRALFLAVSRLSLALSAVPTKFRALNSHSPFPPFPILSLAFISLCCYKVDYRLCDGSSHCCGVQSKLKSTDHKSALF